MNIGIKLKEYRKKRGLRVVDMIRLTGIDRAGLWRIENGKRKPSIETLRKLAKALGISAQTLLE